MVADPTRQAESSFPGAVTADDLRVVAGQLGRRPRRMSAVAVRCPHGFPAVVEVLPVDERGRPFPTLYYLTCPTAVAAIGALESAGGVERFQRAVDGDDGLRAALAGAVVETRTRRQELVRELAHEDAAFRLSAAGTASLATGVGGVADPSCLKCLHAHAAHALARTAYRLGAEIIAAVGELWCEDRRCAAFVPEEAQ
ncbi:MAG: DUF501 domain-containing protein [Thermoleophilia bacterium]|nr:DUF501 domain-containing protein [Thermoleophilia bacterium]